MQAFRVLVEYVVFLGTEAFSARAAVFVTVDRLVVEIFVDVCFNVFRVVSILEIVDLRLPIKYDPGICLIVGGDWRCGFGSSSFSLAEVVSIPVLISGSEAGVGGALRPLEGVLVLELLEEL